MKYRLRFETLAQLDAFLSKGDGAEEYLLPLWELEKRPELIGEFGKRLMAELPAAIWPSQEKRLSERLSALKDKGLSAALAENIGAIGICHELGLEPKGGYGLNILNSTALAEYAGLGIKDATLSFELGFPAMRKIDPVLPSGEKIVIGYIGYGYLPMMKFRSCPMKGPKGCGNCTGFNYLTDRTDTRFPLICRERQYSELLNHLPVYTADKGGPQLDFECLYFTIERPDAVRGIYESYVKGEAPSFLRTAGLYQRKLL